MMIKGITGGRFVDVIGGLSSPPYINSNANATMVGQVRYNPSNQQMEVYDGNNWLAVQSSYPEIRLNGDAIELLEWARTKRAEDAANRQLADSHPAVKAAMANLENAKQQLEVTIILSKEHDKTTS